MVFYQVLYLYHIYWYETEVTEDVRYKNLYLAEGVTRTKGYIVINALYNSHNEKGVHYPKFDIIAYNVIMNIIKEKDILPYLLGD